MNQIKATEKFVAKTQGENEKLREVIEKTRHDRDQMGMLINMKDMRLCQ